MYFIQHSTLYSVQLYYVAYYYCILYINHPYPRTTTRQCSVYNVYCISMYTVYQCILYINVYCISMYTVYQFGGVATQKKPNATANFKFGTGFFSVFFGFFWFFSIFFGFSILANFDWFDGFLLSGSFC